MKTNSVYHFRAAVSAAIGLGVGALAMYLLDPDNGKHRRSRIGKAASDAGDKAVKTITGTAERVSDSVGEGANALASKAGQAVDKAKQTISSAAH